MAERQRHLDAAAEIEKVFSNLGFSLNGAVKVSVPRSTSRKKSVSAAPAVHRRKRKNYSQTGGEFILGLIKAKPLVSAQITAAWRKAGRGGKPENTLGKLVADKKIKRQPVKDGRGSLYSPA